jgi:nitrite reductase/ring-hydroxylating ferredoxin subunit
LFEKALRLDLGQSGGSGLKRRELIGGSLALATLLLTGQPAQAKDISLGKAADIKVGAARVFTIAGSRILVFRQSTSRYSGFIASCPHDATNLLASHVRSARVTCPKDKSVFNATTGRRVSGPTKKSMRVVPIKVTNGFLIATIAAAATTAPTPTPSNSASGEELIKTSRVPVGGGVKVNSKRGEIMVVQPTAGSFAAFSVICNHAGCAVSRATASAIICTCHGSEFSTANGSVIQGPATQGLMRYDIVERDGAIFLR